MRRFHTFFLFVLLLLTACSAPVAPPRAMLPVASVGEVQIREPRLRTPANGQDVSAAYMTLTNVGGAPARLVSASSPAARRIEIHTNIDGTDGIKRMRELDHADIPARDTLLLSPGGLHLMVFGVAPDAVASGTFPITLQLADGTKTSFTMPFVANPSVPTPPAQKGTGDKHH